MRRRASKHRRKRTKRQRSSKRKILKILSKLPPLYGDLTSLGMFPESHGGVCRLGYLRLPPIIYEEGVRGLTRISERLLEVADLAALPGDGPRPPGILTHSRRTAYYYTVLARDLGLLGEHRPMLHACPGYMRLRQTVKKLLDGGEAKIDHGDLISLSAGEKLLFTYIIMRRDPIAPRLAAWALERGSFKRMEGMIHTMEVILPTILRERLDAHEDGSEKISEVLAKLEKYKKIREELCERGIPYGSSAWIRTKSYNAGRHIAAPRLEWLVDLGLLSRRVRNMKVAAYRATSILKACGDAVEKLSRTGDPEELLKSLDIISSAHARRAGLKNPAKKAVEKALIEAFAAISKEVEAVPEPILLLAATARLMEQGYAARIRLVRDALRRLCLVGGLTFKPTGDGCIAITSMESTSSRCDLLYY